MKPHFLSSISLCFSIVISLNIASQNLDAGESGRESASPEIIVFVGDGASNKGNIFTSVELAANAANLLLADGENYSQGKGLSSIRKRIRRIKQLVQNMDVDPSKLRLLLVGKSFSSAKQYRMINEYASFFVQFEKVACVFVDSRSLAGNSNRANQWNGALVYFAPEIHGGRNDYNLAHPKDIPDGDRKFGPWPPELNRKLRIYNIYQRDDRSKKGYSFNSAYRNIDISDGDEDGDNDCITDHFEIELHPKTKELIKEAIQYLKH